MLLYMIHYVLMTTISKEMSIEYNLITLSQLAAAATTGVTMQLGVYHFLDLQRHHLIFAT